jgi:hypothetical protein
MSEELDNELKKRISEVFDNYEDTAPAEDGWKLLREKFPVKKQRRIALLWWSAAAMLLVLCLFGVWFYNQPEKTEQVVVKPVKEIIKPTDSIALSQPLAPQIPGETAVEQSSSQQQFAGTGKKAARMNNSPFATPNTSLSVPGIAPASTSLRVRNQGLLAGTNKTQTPASATQPDNKALLTATNSVKPDSAATQNTNILAQQTVKSQQKEITLIRKDSAVTADESKSRMSIFLANEQKKEADKKPKDEKTLGDKRILYSVYAATYFNYAEGSKSQMNTGAGFGTDIKLFSNFKLSTGVSIGKNTLNYSGQPSQAGILNEAIGVSRTKSNAMASSNVTPTMGFVASRVVVDPVVSGYNVSLTGLDVPINLKYEFNPKKSDSYISAGLSSGTFINETYNYSYDNTANSLLPTPTIPDATTSKSFTRFDFARTLNLSLGMGYQITKNNRLVIEPFLKYPLSGLGSQQIRFGAGGINLRLKFQGAKK